MELNMNKLTGIMREAYSAIGNLTPIKNADCGKLCDKVCCEGKEAGMLLFPGEEIMFLGLRGFEIEEIEYMEISGIKLLLCDGECDRAIRPFACRIFPVAPGIDKNGFVFVRPDLRGRRMCPIWDLKHVDKTFVEAVKKAFRLLAEDGAALSLIRLISAEVDELEKFYR